jgi:FkbM family methyltransferase
MKSEPSAAVVVVSYNYARYVQEAVQSAASQGQLVEEIIVVDGGSTDGTPEVVRAIHEPRLRLITQPNRGLSADRNTGWRAAKAQWIQFLDADDKLAPGAIAMLLEAARQAPGRIPFGLQSVYGPVIEGEPAAVGRLASFSGNVYDEICLRYYGNLQSALMPRKALEELGGYNEQVRFGEDYDLGIRLARRYEFTCVPSVTYCSRMHGSNMHRTASAERLDDYLNIVERNLGREPGPAAWWRHRRAMAHWLWYFGQLALEQGDRKLARQRFRRALFYVPVKLGAWRGWRRAVGRGQSLPTGGRHLNKLTELLHKPEYWFRPRQLFLRWQRAKGPVNPTATVTLPWSLSLNICPNETIGRQIWLMGVFDVVTTETLWRLLDPGELAVDAGANIGYMTSVLAAKAGPKGRVLAFEPHPVLYQRLIENASRWSAGSPSVSGGVAQVSAHNQALSDFTGTGTLFTPVHLEENSGLSTLVAEAGQGGEQIAVAVIRLEEVVAPSESLGVVKLDVEGAELRVLKGAQKLLEQHRIRDIVFEDKEPRPSAVMRFLEGYGYQVFSLGLRLWGPLARPISEPPVPVRSWDSPSYLATLDPQRALARMRKPGWRSLRGCP